MSKVLKITAVGLGCERPCEGGQKEGRKDDHDHDSRMLEMAARARTPDRILCTKMNARSLCRSRGLGDQIRFFLGRPAATFLATVLK
jgi:hypothetical protein